jgi:hypothetical protein
LTPHAVATPAVRAKAAELAASQTDKLGKARAVYDWVRDRVLMVPIGVRQSNPEPRDAEQVMASGLGGSEDRAVLLAALLAALDIRSEFVLTNASGAATISDVPSVEPMDRMLVFLPDFGVYADSSDNAAPFGALPFAELGKPAVHLGGTGPARRIIPIPSFAETASDMTTEETFNEDGTIAGTTVTTARGPFGVWLRENAAAMGKGETASAAATMLLREHGTPGTGDVSPDPLTDTRADYTVRGTFAIPGQAGFLRGGYFVPWTGLRLLPRPGDFLAGPATVQPADRPVFCYPGSQRETVSMRLPEGHTLGSLPRDTKIETQDVRYEAHWVLDGRRMTVVRTFESHVDGPLCDGATAARLARVLPPIRAEIANAVGFERLPTPPVRKKPEY